MSSEQIVKTEIWGDLGTMKRPTESESAELHHRSAQSGILEGLKDHAGSNPLSKPQMKLLILESDLDLPSAGVVAKKLKDRDSGEVSMQSRRDDEAVQRHASWDNSTSASLMFPTLEDLDPTICLEDKQVSSCHVFNDVPNKPHQEKQHGRGRCSSDDGNLTAVYYLDDLYKRSVRNLGTQNRIDDGASTPLEDDTFASFQDHEYPEEYISHSPVIKNAIRGWKTQVQTPSMIISRARSEVTLAPTPVTRKTGLDATSQFSHFTARNDPQAHTHSRPVTLSLPKKDTWTNPRIQATRYERRSLSPFGALAKRQHSMVVLSKKWGNESPIGINTYHGEPVPLPPDFLRTRSDGDHLSNRQQLQSSRANEGTTDAPVEIDMIQTKTKNIAGTNQNDRRRPFTRGRSCRGKSADSINANTCNTSIQNSYFKALKEESPLPDQLRKHNTGRVSPFSCAPTSKIIEQEACQNMDDCAHGDGGYMKKLLLGRRLGQFTSRRFRDDPNVERTSPHSHTTSDNMPFILTGIEAFHHQNAGGVVECIQLTSHGEVMTCSFADANTFLEKMEPVPSILS